MLLRFQTGRTCIVLSLTSFLLRKDKRFVFISLRRHVFEFEFLTCTSAQVPEAPVLRGLDRLRETGFSEAEIDQFRQQFRASRANAYGMRNFYFFARRESATCVDELSIEDSNANTSIFC